MPDNIGMPEDTELTQRRIIEGEARRETNRADLERIQRARQADAERRNQKSNSTNAPSSGN